MRVVAGIVKLLKKAWLPVALAAYVFVPVDAVRLFLAGMLIWEFLRTQKFQAMGLLAAVVYACAFLLNPICYYLRPPAVLGWEIFFVAFGCLWLGLCLAWGRQFRLKKFMPSAMFLLVWWGLILAAYLRSWLADLAYGGDEVFHVISIQIRWLMLRDLSTHGTVIAMGVVWLALAIAVVWWKPKGKGVMYAVGVLALVFEACCSPWMYSAKLLQNPYTSDRVFRFPAAESWVSAFLGGLERGNWQRTIFSNETSRLLPLLAVFALGLVFGGDRRWRRVPVLLTCLAVWGIATIPDILYHGTIVYLELPLVVLACVVVLDSRHWLETSFPNICRRFSWWALVLMGFTKETAIPLIASLLVLRMAYRVRRWQDLGGEIVMWFCALGPALLYLWIRQSGGARPYAAQWGNLLQPSLWLSNLGYLWQQAGVLIVLAILGCVVLWRKGRWQLVLVAGGLFVVEQMFLLGDNAQYVGMARFNLLLLPPIIVLGWEGLTWLLQENVLFGATAVGVLLVANLLMSPVDRHGDRAAWGNSDERWYPYEQCFTDIRAKHPDARLLLGNMECAYGYSVIMQQIGWSPEVIPIHSFATNGLENVERTLADAVSRRCDVVVYRDDDDLQLPTTLAEHGFALTARYPARVGELIVFSRVASENSPVGAR